MNTMYYHHAVREKKKVQNIKCSKLELFQRQLQ